MLINDFMKEYSDHEDDYTVDHVHEVLERLNVPYYYYSCPDAIVLLFKKTDHIKAYLLFRKFSKDVFRLLQRVDASEPGEIRVETKDPRIVKWMGRLGLSVTEVVNDTTFLTRAKRNV